MKYLVLIVTAIFIDNSEMCFTSEPVISSGIIVETVGYIETGRFYLNPNITSYEIRGDSMTIEGTLSYGGEYVENALFYSVKKEKRTLREIVGGRHLYKISNPLLGAINTSGIFRVKIQATERMLILPDQPICTQPILVEWGKCN